MPTLRQLREGLSNQRRLDVAKDSLEKASKVKLGSHEYHELMAQHHLHMATRAESLEHNYDDGPFHRAAEKHHRNFIETAIKGNGVRVTHQ